MGRKLAIIFILAIAFAGFLYLQPWLFRDKEPPRLYDRLPEAQIIGKSNVLDLSRALSSVMFYYKVPFREFLSHEFILGQGKSYGVDVQKPVYFFMNRSTKLLPEEWGVIAHVNDSSKIHNGIQRLRKSTKLNDTSLFGTKVFQFAESDFNITYGGDWILIYSGKNLSQHLKHILSAKRNEITPKWRAFLNDNTFNDKSIVANVVAPELANFGIESSFLSLSNDSVSLTLHTKLIHQDTLPIKIKKSGMSLTEQGYTKHIVNLHLDVEQLRKKPEDLAYKSLQKICSKIGLPFVGFLNAWEGDIAFRQGGIQTITEKYIESEFDENFNVSEVEKFKDVKIPGFTLYLSMNNNGKSFISQLFSKGILTTDGDKFRLLYSPPLKLQITDSQFMVHTSHYPSKLHSDTLQYVMWTINYTPVKCYVDSMTYKFIYGHVDISLKKIMSDNFPVF